MSRALLASLALLVACGPGNASTAYDACMEQLDIGCECGDPSFPDDPYFLCDYTEEQRIATCERYGEDEGRASDEWIAWMNCKTTAMASECEVTQDEVLGCGEAPEEERDSG